MDNFDPHDPFQVAYAELWARDVHLELRRAARKRYRTRARSLSPKRVARGLAVLTVADGFTSRASRAEMRDAYVSKLPASKRRAFWHAYRAQRKALRVNGGAA